MDVAEHCQAPFSDARKDALFFGLVQYCGVGDELVPSYIRDSSCEMPQVTAHLFVVAPTSRSHTVALIQHKHCTALIQ